MRAKTEHEAGFHQLENLSGCKSNHNLHHTANPCIRGLSYTIFTIARIENLGLIHNWNKSTSARWYIGYYTVSALMLLVVNSAISKWCENTLKMTEPLAHGLNGFQKTLRQCALDESSLSIGSVQMIESLAHGFSSERTQWELSNEYQHDRV